MPWVLFLTIYVDNIPYEAMMMVGQNNATMSMFCAVFPLLQERLFYLGKLIQP
jgi:hypothetical protein